MGAERDRILEDLFAQYQQQRSSLTDLHRRMQEVTATATSPRREVSVTVGRSGQVTDIKFLSSAYKRLPQAALAAMLMKAITDATEQAQAQVAEMMAPMLPPSVDARALVAGRLGISAFAPEDGPDLPQTVREYFQQG
jgi:DNA-binding protein YbaB